MKVSELINKLEKVNQDLEVVIQSSVADFDYMRAYSIHEIDLVFYDDDPDQKVPVIAIEYE